MAGSSPQADPVPSHPTPPGVRILPVEPRFRLEAIERLVARPGAGGRGHAERFLEYAEANRIALDSAWVRLDASDRIAATALAVVSPGRTAILFVTLTRHLEDVQSQAALIAHASEAMARLEIDLIQVLLEPDEQLHREAFLEAGFRKLAHLHYMERPSSRKPGGDRESWPVDVQLRPYDPSRRDDVLRILEASYVQTLDCPDLRGLRRTEDILIGHQATGQFDPQLWTLLYRAGRPSGALLLNPAPGSNTIELVYTGLAPEIRGLGLGRRLLRHGLRQIAHRSERAVTLAVDERNAPAIALYRGEGFRRVLRRIALIRPLRRVNEEGETG